MGAQSLKCYTLGGLLMVGATSAVAEPRFYVSAQGGIAFVSDDDTDVMLEGTRASEIEYDIGTLGAGAIGVSFEGSNRTLWDRFRVELEGGRFGNDHDELRFDFGDGTSDSVSFSGDTSLSYGLLHLLAEVDVPMVPGVSFYAGPMIGYGNVDVDGAAGGIDVDDDETVFMFGGRGGFGYDITERLIGNVGFRFISSEEVDVSTSVGEMDFDYRQRVLEFGLRYQF